MQSQAQEKLQYPDLKQSEQPQVQISQNTQNDLVSISTQSKKKTQKYQLKKYLEPGQISEGSELSWFMGQILSDPVIAAVGVPLIMITSPVWLTLGVRGLINSWKKDSCISSIEKELEAESETKKVSVETKKKIAAQMKEYHNNSYPIVISKRNSKKIEMMVFAPRKETHNCYCPVRWWYVVEQFKKKTNLLKPNQNVFFFAGTQVLHQRYSVEEVYQKFKSPDGILYVQYEVLETF